MASLPSPTAHTFLFELREQCDQALHLAEEWSKHAGEWSDVVDGSDANGLPTATDERAQLRAQAGMFTATEGLLAALGRVSLILFPTAGTAKTRGLHLRNLLGIDEAHDLADRAIRNDWMHFDERLDSLLGDGMDRRTQCFRFARDLSSDLKRECLRLFVPESGEVWILEKRIAPEDLSETIEDLIDRIDSALVRAPPNKR